MWALSWARFQDAKNAESDRCGCSIIIGEFGNGCGIKSFFKRTSNERSVLHTFVLCVVYFHSYYESGRTWPPVSGYRPKWKVDALLRKQMVDCGWSNAEFTQFSINNKKLIVHWKIRNNILENVYFGNELTIFLCKFEFAKEFYVSLSKSLGKAPPDRPWCLQGVQNSLTSNINHQQI